MTIRRNWFVRFAVFLALAVVVMILFSAFSTLQEQTGSDYLLTYVLLIAFAAAFLLLYLVAGTARFLRNRLVSTAWKRLGWGVTLILILGILAAGFYLRHEAVLRYPIAMESDYKLYYDIAKMLYDGTIQTESANEYIALFPHTFGYGFLLSIAMRIFGTQPEVCYYFNIAVSLISALFLFGIGKTLFGTGAGLVAMAISAFWPSQILFSVINGAEAVFTAILYGTALYAVYLLRKCDGKHCGSSARAILMHMGVGVLIAFASFVRPMAVVFVIAVALCLTFLTTKLDPVRIRENKFSYIFVSNGILRAVAVLLGYALCAALLTAGVQAAIGREVAGSGATGYSLMVGTDLESDGGYSERSMNYLYAAYEATEDPNQAHALCMKVAIASVREHPWETLRLLAKKAYILWSNDDYASTTVFVSMNEQEQINGNIAVILDHFAVFNNVFYLAVLFFAAAGLILMLQNDSNAALFAIFFIGAVALHLLVEVQNRYHYYLLQCLAILASSAVGYLMARKQAGECKQGTVPGLPPTEANQEPSPICKIDVLQAIIDGHITVTASTAYRPAAAPTVASENEVEI